MRVLIAFEGEAIDQLCRRAYGTEAGHVEAVLDANPGLAALPKRLPAGTAVRVPDVVAQSPDPVVKLWD